MVRPNDRVLSTVQAIERSLYKRRADLVGSRAGPMMDWQDTQFGVTLEVGGGHEVPAHERSCGVFMSLTVGSYGYRVQSTEY